MLCAIGIAASEEDTSVEPSRCCVAKAWRGVGCAGFGQEIQKPIAAQFFDYGKINNKAAQVLRVLFFEPYFIAVP